MAERKKQRQFIFGSRLPAFHSSSPVNSSHELINDMNEYCFTTTFSLPVWLLPLFRFFALEGSLTPPQ
jgi:hypothetical protein